MKKTRYSEGQIAFALRQAESGTPIVEVCRKMGISEQTFFRWKKKFAGMGIAEVRRLKQLEEENRKLKQFVDGGHAPEDHLFLLRLVSGWTKNSCNSHGARPYSLLGAAQGRHADEGLEG